MDYNNTKIDKKGSIDLDTWYKMKVFSNEKNLNDSSGPISNSIEDINCVDNRTEKDLHYIRRHMQIFPTTTN